MRDVNLTLSTDAPVSPTLHEHAGRPAVYRSPHIKKCDRSVEVTDKSTILILFAVHYKLDVGASPVLH